MALTIDVPDHVTFEQRAAACKALGLDPETVKRVELDADAYDIVVVVEHPAPRGGWPVTARLTIPVIWPDAADTETGKTEGPF